MHIKHAHRANAPLITVWLVMALALAAGASRADQVPAAGPTAAPQLTDSEMLARAVKVGRRTSLLRGLRMRRKVSMGFLTRAAVTERIEQQLAKEYTEQEIRQEADVLRSLGLLPKTLDYRKAVLDLLKDQVAGFYDPDRRTLNLARWVPFALQESALAHELCHALQDQHFGLKSYTRPIKDNSDRQLARAALVEGDCTGVMLEYVLRDKGIDLGDLPSTTLDQIRASLINSGGSVFQTSPRFLRETLVFPYVHGLAFMQQLRVRHPWSVVSRMFKAPPESTEQILHYRKYWDRERPVVIRSSALAQLAGHKRIRRDVLGEFQLSLYLEQGVNPLAARRAAAGWGGDLLEAYRKVGVDGPPLLLHLTTWDSEADALEFSNALRYVLLGQGRTAAATHSQPAGGPRRWLFSGKGDLRWAVELQGKHVAVIHATPAALVAGLLQGLWSRWSIGGRRGR